MKNQVCMVSNKQDINKLKVIIPNEFENESKKIPYRKIKK